MVEIYNKKKVRRVREKDSWLNWEIRNKQKREPDQLE